MTRYDVAFAGKAAHAAGSPEKGRNALDAVMLLFHAVNAWRQQLPESGRVHGIVTDGGAAPNIIPETAACRFYLRSPDDAMLARMCRRFERIARGAALMTDTEAGIAPDDVPYKAGNPNKPLNEAYLEAAANAGFKTEKAVLPGRASTDFSEISRNVPGSHVYFSIARQAIATHSVAFREAAGSAHGLRQMLRAAEALAWVGYRYCTDADFQARVRAEFRRPRRAAT